MKQLLTKLIPKVYGQLFNIIALFHKKVRQNLPLKYSVPSAKDVFCPINVPFLMLQNWQKNRLGNITYKPISGKATGLLFYCCMVGKVIRLDGVTSSKNFRSKISILLLWMLLPTGIPVEHGYTYPSTQQLPGM